MRPYKIAVNMEWTSKCNARCIMCPIDQVENPQLTSLQTFAHTMDRINPTDVNRVVIAGYGEPTTHPEFFNFIDQVRLHPVSFDLVTNAALLDTKKIAHLDGAINTLMVSFSSIDPKVYQSVHVNLDYDSVTTNIINASKQLKHTNLAISLTPLPECIDTLEQTINWFHSLGITTLSMSPTLYNRAGHSDDLEIASSKLRFIIKKYGLHSQELDFIPSVADSCRQYLNNRFKCIPRNSDLLISASGDYLYCYNDVSHSHQLGNVTDMSLREAIQKREKTAEIPDLCHTCNMKDRYKAREVAGVASRYGLNKLIALRSA